MEGELERLRRFLVAHDYVKATEKLAKSEEELEGKQQSVKELEQAVKECARALKEIAGRVGQVQADKAKVCVHLYQSRHLL